MAFEKQLKVQIRKAQGSAAGQIPGRLGGIQLGIPAAPGQYLAVSYRYDTFGRFDLVVSGGTNSTCFWRFKNHLGQKALRRLRGGSRRNWV